MLSWRNVLSRAVVLQRASGPTPCLFRSIYFLLSDGVDHVPGRVFASRRIDAVDFDTGSVQLLLRVLCMGSIQDKQSKNRHL